MKTLRKNEQKRTFLKTFATLVVALICFSNFSFSQELASPKEKTTEWKQLFNDGKCLISYKYGDCDNKEEGFYKEEVYLKFDNLSLDVVNVYWDLELKYGEKCFNCNGDNDELKFSVSLKPKQSIEGSCGSVDYNKLNIFSKFKDGISKSELADFQLKNISYRND